eukprot:scaffold22587_cov70-Cyclotella_meneghiniana.AAC.5
MQERVNQTEKISHEDYRREQTRDYNCTAEKTARGSRVRVDSLYVGQQGHEFQNILIRPNNIMTKSEIRATMNQ